MRSRPLTLRERDGDGGWEVRGAIRRCEILGREYSRVDLAIRRLRDVCRRSALFLVLGFNDEGATHEILEDLVGWRDGSEWEKRVSGAGYMQLLCGLIWCSPFLHSEAKLTGSGLPMLVSEGRRVRLDWDNEKE